MITKSLFGRTSDGKEVNRYFIENENGMSFAAIEFGAVLQSVCVKNKNGNIADVVLGYDSVAGYENDDTYLGAVVGRYANRIGKAKFYLNGIVYKLDANDGENHLHGGFDGYDKRVWNSRVISDNSVVFELTSADMDQGYPGNMDIKVQYTLTDDDELVIDYYGKSDKATICNLTNHSYFNLGGHDSGTAAGQLVWIDADYYTEADANSITTGRILPVKGTPMDFTAETVIGERIDNDFDQLNFGHGYDHNWVLKNNRSFAKVASLRDTGSGRYMEVYTDLPGVQFYSGNFLKGAIAGKNGTRYLKRSGVCFETQYFPDSINKPDFPQPVLKAEEEYRTTTMYKFC